MRLQIPVVPTNYYVVRTYKFKGFMQEKTQNVTLLVELRAEWISLKMGPNLNFS